MKIKNYKMELINYLETQENESIKKSWEIFFCPAMRKKYKIDFECITKIMEKRGIKQ